MLTVGCSQAIMSERTYRPHLNIYICSAKMAFPVIEHTIEVKGFIERVCTVSTRVLNVAYFCKFINK